jgi:hypothetical protein
VETDAVGASAAVIVSPTIGNLTTADAGGTGRTGRTGWLLSENRRVNRPAWMTSPSFKAVIVTGFPFNWVPGPPLTSRKKDTPSGLGAISKWRAARS